MEAPDCGDGASKAPFDGDAVDEMMATPKLPDWDCVSGHLHHGGVYESALAMAAQMHSHRHSVPCFKRTRSGRPRECRYGFPREPRKEAETDGEGGVLVRRPVGCEYINPHNRLVLVTLRCNTDLRILQANDVVLYTVKYVLKPMADDERDAILMLNRFQRVVNAEQTDPPRSGLRTAARRVCASAYAATELQEMPATLAAIYLLYKKGRITSHTSVPLLMPQLLAVHEGDLAALTVTPTRGKHGGVPNCGVPRHPGGGAQAAADDVQAGAEGADGDGAGDSPRTMAAAVGEEVVPADVDGNGGDGDGNGDEDGENDTPRRFVLISQTLDYRLRPVVFSHLSPYEMYEKYEKRKI